MCILTTPELGQLNKYSTNLKIMMAEVSFIYAAVTEWNKLPLEIKEVQKTNI